MSLRHARRTIGLLAACQGLLGTNNVLNIGVTGLAGYALAPDKAWATLPLTAYVVGAALSTLPASFWMKKVGRRMGFVTGATMGSCGSAINALAMIDHRFGLLIAGTFLAGGYNAFGPGKQANATIGRAIRLALQALERLHSEGVSAEMLASARAYTLGQYALGLETAADWAAALADIEFFGLGTGYIDDYPAALEEVDPHAARAAIDEAFPTPEQVTLVVIGDAARIGGQLAEFGPIVPMRLTDPDFVPGAAGDEAPP